MDDGASSSPSSAPTPSGTSLAALRTSRGKAHMANKHRYTQMAIFCFIGTHRRITQFSRTICFYPNRSAFEDPGDVLSQTFVNGGGKGKSYTFSDSAKARWSASVQGVGDFFGSMKQNRKIGNNKVSQSILA